MKVTAIIQARMTSTRLPGKILKEIMGRPMLSYMLERVRQTERVDRIVIATTTNREDDPVAHLADQEGIACFRGSEENVLERFYLAAREFSGQESIMRLTGDCPIIDPELLGSLIGFYEEGNWSYASNCLEPTLPDGLDAEIFSFAALESAYREARLPSELEHVTPFIRNYPERFSQGSWKYEKDLSRHRWTVDEPEDFEFISKVIERLYPNNSRFRFRDVLALLFEEPSLVEINNTFDRNEGLAKSLQEDKTFLARNPVSAWVGEQWVMDAGTLFIRADATRNIGAGHVMRCLSLAQSWKKRGGRVLFIGHFGSIAIQERIKEEGFSLVLLENSYPDGNDLGKTMKTVAVERSGRDGDWLVLDGYHLDEGYQREVSAVGIPVLVVDDNHHFFTYHADAILNPNIYAPKIKYRTSAEIILLGGNHSLLRTEFAQWDDWKRDIPRKASRICVTLGGADNENVTGKVLSAMALMSDQDLDVRVVVGPTNPHLDTLRKSVESLPFAVRFLEEVKDMPALMAWADMAVSAAGGTCLELACMGVPAITIITADNQETNAAIFAEKEIFTTMGWWNSFGKVDLAEKITELINNRVLRSERSARGRRLVPSSGADNSVDALLAFSAGNKEMVESAARGVSNHE